MKCYVITISEKFPSSHLRVGEPTDFVKSIERFIKRHTIKSNYDYWKTRLDEVAAGKAYLSVRTWTGKPYNSKQREVYRFNANDGVGIERLKIDAGRVIIEGKESKTPLTILAKNDGLSIEDFKEWFKDYPKGEEMGIIHFSGFRYNLR